MKLDVNKLPKCESDDKINVLYLMYASIEYENYGYTIRTHNLLNNTINDKYELLGVTKYGYPLDREIDYYKDTPEVEYQKDNVKYIKLLDEDDNFNNNNIIDYLTKYITSVIKLAVSHNTKIIHATSNYWNGIVALYAAKFLGIKSVYEIRGFWDEGATAFKPEIKDTDMIKMMISMEKKIFAEIDCIITINQPLKDKLIDDGFNEEKIKVVYNGVDTSVFEPNDSVNKKLRQEHNVEMTDIVIGYIGTFSYFEGIDYVLKCVKMLLKKGKSIKFVMIGDGIIKTELLKLIEELKITDNVLYLGKMDNESVIAYYNMFDVVAYPRRRCDLCNSTSSYKVFEAMSMKKPIIVSELDAWKEIITDMETGIYCKPDDIDDLFTKLELVINDEDLRNKLGNNAREWVIDNREWKNNGRILQNIYDDLIES